jgi:alpha-mannosidase
MQGRASIVGEEEIVRISRRYARTTLPCENEQRLVFLNASVHEFDGFMECEPFIDFDDWGDRWFADENGEPAPFQLIASEPSMGAMVHRVVLPVNIPAQGQRILSVLNNAPRSSPPLLHPVKASANSLASGDLAVTTSTTGISSIMWKGRELLGAAGLSLHLREDHGDTWVFHQTGFDEEIVARLGGLEWKVEDQGPLRTRAFTEQKIGNSMMRLAVTMYAGCPEIHLHLQVVFAERYKILQMPIHLTIAPSGWTSGQAGGLVQRNAGPDEMPFCGWDSIRGDHYNISLHTPDAYSSRLLEDTWQISLLRSPLMAWAGDTELPHSFSQRHSDQGWHDFHFIIRIDDVLDTIRCEKVSDHQAKPPVVFDHYVGMNRPAWGNAPPRRLWTPDIPHARSLGHMKHLDAIASQGRNWEESPD